MSTLAPARGLAAVLLWCVACSDDAGSGREEARSRYCEVLCNRLSACGRSQRPAACTAACSADPFAKRINPQIWSGQTECLTHVSCAALDSDETLDACYFEAVDALQPSSSCIDYCLGDAAESFECGAGYSVEDCLTTGICAWSEAILSEALACNAGANCDERLRCQQIAFGAL
jgi:hypothetical protein